MIFFVVPARRLMRYPVISGHFRTTGLGCLVQLWRHVTAVRALAAAQYGLAFTLFGVSAHDSPGIAFLRFQMGTLMDQQHHATAAWLAATPHENTHFRKISTAIYLLELDILTGHPAPPTRYGRWIRHMHELQQFQRETGRMPKRRSTGGETESVLAEWVHHQCQRQHTMCGYAAARLEAIPSWQWNPRTHEWDNHLAALAEFVCTRGRVPTPTAGDQSERSLARWVQHQRDISRAGHLPAERVAKLRDLGFPMPKQAT